MCRESIQREAGGSRTPVKPQTFHYKKPPPERQGVKEVVIMCQSPTMRGSVHVLRHGSGENLHSHSSVDGFWMVLSGKVSFYGEGDVCYGEFGPMEGIMMPRNNRYWFECISDADAEILQVLQFDREQGFQREDHAMPKYSKEDVRLFYGGTRSKKQ